MELFGAGAPASRALGGARDAGATMGQRALWLFDQLNPGSPVYNLPFAVRTPREVDPAALRAAFERLASLHSALGMRFELRARELRQVHDGGAGAFAFESRAVDDEAAAERLMSGEIRRPFDLRAGPLMRVTLYRCAAERSSVMLVVLHHIIADGVSIDLLLRDLGAAYAAHADPSRAAALPSSDFAAYAEAENARAGAVMTRHAPYWARRLDEPARRVLPTDKPRGDAASFDAGAVQLGVGGAAYERLKQLAKRVYGTSFNVFLTAWAVVLARYTSQRSVVLAVAVDVRGFSPALRSLVGYCVNLVPVRVDVDWDATVLQLLDRAQEDALEAYSHAELPYARIVEAVKPPRSAAWNPLCQAGIAMQPQISHLTVFGDDAIRLMYNDTMKLELVLSCTDEVDRMDMRIDFATSLFEPETVAGLARDLEGVLTRMAGDVDVPVRALLGPA